MLTQDYHTQEWAERAAAVKAAYEAWRDGYDKPDWDDARLMGDLFRAVSAYNNAFVMSTEKIA